VASASLVPSEPGLTAPNERSRAVARRDSDHERSLPPCNSRPPPLHEHVAALHQLPGTGTRRRFLAALAQPLRDDL
jgi:hypothetical protein